MKFSNYNLIIWDDIGKQQILFHTLSGNCFTLDDQTAQAIRQNRIDLMPQEEIKMLKEKNIIINDDTDESRYIEYFHNLSKFDTSHLSFTILLTWACNLRCIYCYEGAGELHDIALDADDCKAILAFMKKQIICVRPRQVSFMLFGGEPLMNIKAAEQILTEMDRFCGEQELVYQTGIITNGTLLSEEIVQFLIKFHCNYIQITLDGIKGIHDKRRVSKDGSSSFDKIIHALELLKAQSDCIKPVLRINVDKDNVNAIAALLAELKRRNFTKLQLDFGIVHNGTKACFAYADRCFREEELGERLNTLWQMVRKYGFPISPRPFSKFLYCGLNREQAYTIAPNLDVYKCWEQVGDEQHKIGTIRHDGAFTENMKQLADWMSINPTKIEACKKCAYLPVCGGGCAARAYERYGTYHAPGCFQVKGVIEKEILDYLRQKKMITS